MEDLLKKYDPTTPGRRGKASVIVKFKKDDSLLSSKRVTKSTAGRNSYGRITSPHRKGRINRKVVRMIDHSYKFESGTIKGFEKDPHRSNLLAKVSHKNGMSYIPAIDGLNVNSNVSLGSPDLGGRLKLSDIKMGTEISHISKPGFKGSAYCRAAGTFAVLLGQDGSNSIVRMMSGEKRMFPSHCEATIGRCANRNHMHINLGKAGTSFRLGRRPIVRGIAQSAHDHPMGGKSGKLKGHVPKTRWGKLAKGKRTRRGKKPSWFILKRKDV